MRLAILGFGLIGGSVARAVRAGLPDSPFVGSISAWSPSGNGPASARADGVVDRVGTSLADAVEGADLVVLAADPLACLDLLGALARLPPAVDPATITDVASTKAAIGQRADALGLPFVGGHPLAGLETSGYRNSRADLFRGRPWVLCSGVASRPIDLERAEALVAACGAERTWLAPAEHDRAVAAISHLPLALSAALVESVGMAADWPLAQQLAAGGWQSATRLARGDPGMGAGIAATNAPELARRLRAIQAQLADWLADLEATPDDPVTTAARVRRRLDAARARLEMPR
ncbi:MAG: prephenate dehydrogenase [Candidatus Limnocylindrales bacterium]